jgi:hypothetical protein
MLRRLKARTLPDLIDALKQALSAIPLKIFRLGLLIVVMPSFDQIFALGGSVCQRPPTQDAQHCVERFLFMSGSDLRGKVNALGGYTGPEA